MVLVLFSPGEDHAQMINALYSVGSLSLGAQSTSVGEDSRTSAFELLVLDMLDTYEQWYSALLSTFTRTGLGDFKTSFSRPGLCKPLQVTETKQCHAPKW